MHKNLPLAYAGQFWRHKDFQSKWGVPLCASIKKSNHMQQLNETGCHKQHPVSGEYAEVQK